MTFRVMSPRPPQKAHTAIHSSPSFSQYGRSPSLVGPYYTTDDLAAARYAKYSWWLHCTRIALTVVVLAVSIAVVACAAVSLHGYSSSQVEPEYLLPLWPLTVDQRPTHAVLGCGIVILIFSLAYLIMAFVPLPRKLHHLNLASTALSLPAFTLALFTAIFASVITNHLSSSISAGSIQSWTCKWQGSANPVLGNFHNLCKNSSAALDLVIFLAIFEALALVTTLGGWLIEWKLKKFAKGGAKSEVELV